MNGSYEIFWESGNIRVKGQRTRIDNEEEVRIGIWKDYDDTRKRNLNNKLDKIYGDLGDVLIFDTHGYHSDFKNTTVPRSVINLTIEPCGNFMRLNKKNLNSEIKRLNMQNINQILSF